MKKLLFMCLFLLSVSASAKVVDINSPFNYQTTGKNVKVTFSVNAATLMILPSKILLIINDIPVKEISYHSSKYFQINDLADGTYTIKIALFDSSKKMVHITDPIKFNVREKPLKVAPMATK